MPDQTQGVHFFFKSPEICWFSQAWRRTRNYITSRWGRTCIPRKSSNPLLVFCVLSCRYQLKVSLWKQMCFWSLWTSSHAWGGGENTEPMWREPTIWQRIFFLVLLQKLEKKNESFFTQPQYWEKKSGKVHKICRNISEVSQQKIFHLHLGSVGKWAFSLGGKDVSVFVQSTFGKTLAHHRHRHKAVMYV